LEETAEVVLLEEKIANFSIDVTLGSYNFSNQRSTNLSAYRIEEIKLSVFCLVTGSECTRERIDAKNSKYSAHSSSDGQKNPNTVTIRAGKGLQQLKYDTIQFPIALRYHES